MAIAIFTFVTAICIIRKAVSLWNKSHMGCRAGGTNTILGTGWQIYPHRQRVKHQGERGRAFKLRTRGLKAPR